MIDKINCPRYLIILLLFIYTSNVIAQNTGNITLKIFPPVGNSKVMIGDSTLVTSSQIQDFPEGNYRIQIWAKYYEYLDTTINVIPDSTIIFKAKLSHPPEFFTFKKELTNYERKVLFKQKLPDILFYSFLTTGVGLFATTVNNGKIIELKEEYDLSGPDPVRIEAAQNEFDDQKRKLKRNRVISYVLLGTSVSMKLLNIRNKKAKNINYFQPTYDAKKPDYISYNINWGMHGLTLNLNF